MFYYIDRGNNSKESWDGPHGSGEEITVSHTWNEEEIYTIKVNAKDIYDFESDFVSLEVNMPKNKMKSNNIKALFLQFFENHPNMFPLLRQLLGI